MSNPVLLSVSAMTGAADALTRTPLPFLHLCLPLFPYLRQVHHFPLYPPRFQLRMLAANPGRARCGSCRLHGRSVRYCFSCGLGCFCSLLVRQARLGLLSDCNGVEPSMDTWLDKRSGVFRSWLFSSTEAVWCARRVDAVLLGPPLCAGERQHCRARLYLDCCGEMLGSGQSVVSFQLLGHLSIPQLLRDASNNNFTVWSSTSERSSYIVGLWTVRAQVSRVLPLSPPCA